MRSFSRYHKYTLGADLRDGARRVLKLIVRANARRDKTPLLLEVREEVEELKVVRYLCQDCFVTGGPKPREVFAADFRDRIVHHLLVARWAWAVGARRTRREPWEGQRGQRELSASALRTTA